MMIRLAQTQSVGQRLQLRGWRDLELGALHAARGRGHHTERGGNYGEPLDPIVVDALHKIHAGIGQPLRVPQLASQVGVSQRSLNRWFQQQLGCTVVEVIRHVRLTCARQWLSSRPDLPVTQVAAMVGYSSPNRMENHFQEALGVSPRAYRRQMAPPLTLESSC